MNKNLKEFEEVNCNLCNSNNYVILYASQFDKEKDLDLVEKFRASGDELLVDQVVKCKKCGHIYINPRLKSDTIIKAYSEGEDPTFVSQADSRERTFFKALKKIERYTGHKGKVLDVGTAGGSFLGAAKRRGWIAEGCEPNKWMAKWGEKKYGVKISPGTIFEQKYPSNKFDLVTLWDVIEHTPDPSKVLRECNRILKEKGTLVVNYPDIDSWISKLMGRKWLFLTSVHLHYFTPKTIKKILEKEGFEVKLIKPHFQELELGYLFKRAALLSNIISKIGYGIVNAIGLSHKPVPYWLGQTFVIAKKESI